MKTPTSPKINTVAVFTSGGDAPGMNAALRAVTRTALLHGLKVKGILSGYQGLYHNQFIDLNAGSMANILQRGGTILKTARLDEFHDKTVRQKCIDILNAQGVDALICIGGDGSFRGAHLLYQESGIPVAGIPGTIDNDIPGTDYTIGFDTALNTALEAIDRIRDTAASHDRLFIVEVMGRESGFIATYVGIAGGAEEVFFPDRAVNLDETIAHIRRGLQRGKKSSILVTAEGHKPGRGYDLADAIRKRAGFDAKVCVLGHIQRGGVPTALDRIRASQFGNFAVERLLKGESDFMTAWVDGNLKSVPLNTVFNSQRKVPSHLIELAKALST